MAARGPKELSVRTQEHRSTSLSGDLQGLSRTPGADSESVSELVEEGTSRVLKNAYKVANAL